MSEHELGIPLGSIVSTEGNYIRFLSPDGQEGEITQYGAMYSAVCGDEEERQSQETEREVPGIRDSGYDVMRDDFNRPASEVYGKRGQVSKAKK